METNLCNTKPNVSHCIDVSSVMVLSGHIHFDARKLYILYLQGFTSYGDEQQNACVCVCVMTYSLF